MSTTWGTYVHRYVSLDLSCTDAANIISAKERNILSFVLLGFYLFFNCVVYPYIFVVCIYGTFESMGESRAE